MRPATVVLVTDLGVLSLTVWLCSVAFGRVATLQVTFAVLLFASLVLWQTDLIRLTATVLDDLGPIWRRVTGSFALSVAASIALGRGDQHLVLWTAALSAVGLPLGRLIAHSFGRYLLTIGRPKAVVLGGGVVSRQIIEAVDRCDNYSFDIVGVLDDEPRFDSRELGRPLIGKICDLSRTIRMQGISVVIVAFTLSDPCELINIVRGAQKQGASVWVVPRFFELGLPGVSRDRVWGLPLLGIAAPPNRRPVWLLKRALDVALSAVGLLVTTPLMALIAILVFIDSGRPILYRQTRISSNRREFDILKFRTMKPVAPAVDGKEWAPDPGRVTRLGRFLRDKSLDELPQLFNVVRGDMSLVGPRPERPFFVREFCNRYDRYDQRLRVPAGITGWAQVNGLRGNDSPIEDRVAFDNYYAENWSLSEDLKIILRTFKALRGPIHLRQQEPKRSPEKDACEE